MANNSIILPKDVDVDKISLGDTKPMGLTGGKLVRLKYNKTHVLTIQTPLMSAPFGVNKWAGDGKSADKYSLDLSFRGAAERPQVREFLSVLEKLDERLINEGVANSKEWLGKPRLSIDVVKELYTPTVKWAKDKTTGEVTDKYPPTFKMNIPMKDGKLDLEIYNEAGEQIPVPADHSELVRLTKGSRIAAIAQCSGVWLAGKKFGVSWKVQLLQLRPGNVIKGFAFRQVVDDDEEAAGSDLEEAVPAAKAAAKATPVNKGVAAVSAALASATIHTSDEEDDGDEDDDADSEGTPAV
jgi:hypothetical protein